MASMPAPLSDEFPAARTFGDAALVCRTKAELDAALREALSAPELGGPHLQRVLELAGSPRMAQAQRALARLREVCDPSCQEQ